MIYKNVNYKRTEGKGYYENKENKDHCVDDENTDPMFYTRRLSTIYRKKPVEIEAWEFTREALKSDDSWVRLYVDELHLISQYAGEVLYIEIDTLEGTMRANLGDFIIKGVQGEFYPCKPDIFEQTYEKVG